MKLTYDNDCKLYCKDDTKNEEKFNEIMKKCYDKKEAETKSDFCYPENEQIVELIVRVPYLLSLYRDDTKLFEECHEDFQELFDFYETQTLVDLRLELPLMVARVC